MERCLYELDRTDVLSLSDPVRGRDGSECVPAELGSMLEAVPTSRDDPVTAALSGDRTRVVRDAIESLSEQERMVLFLIHAEGLTGSETGSLIGVTESRVSQILSGTRRKLRRYLDGQTPATYSTSPRSIQIPSQTSAARWLVARSTVRRTLGCRSVLRRSRAGNVRPNRAPRSLAARGNLLA